MPVVNTAGDFDPLFWAAAESDAGDVVYLKVINIAAEPQPLSVALEAAWSAVNGTIITDNDPNGFNYKDNQTAIVPVPLNLTSTSRAVGQAWNWTVPAYSINVLQFNL